MTTLITKLPWAQIISAQHRAYKLGKVKTWTSGAWPGYPLAGPSDCFYGEMFTSSIQTGMYQ